MTTLPSGAVLQGAVHAHTRAVVVLLHGASVGSNGSTSWLSPAPMRMQWFAPGIALRSMGRIAVLRLRHPDREMKMVYRGALNDTAAVLTHIKKVAPRARIALVGHSNGGRVALKLSSDSRVTAVAALAPWLTGYDRIAPRRGVPVLLMHGDLDFVTSAKLTDRLATRLRDRGVQVDHETVRSDNHFMTSRSNHWHRRVADFLVKSLLKS